MKYFVLFAGLLLAACGPSETKPCKPELVNGKWIMPEYCIYEGSESKPDSVVTSTNPIEPTTEPKDPEKPKDGPKKDDHPKKDEDSDKKDEDC